MRIHGRFLCAAGLVSVLLGTAACSTTNPTNVGDTSAGTPPEKPTLTLYNAQHEDLMKLMVAGFTRTTGIPVNMRNGEDFGLGNQLVQEDTASPADVFVTENSPAMTLVDSKGLFTRVQQATLAQVPPQFAPDNKNWVGFAARSTVLAYNSAQLKPADLPASLMDLAAPKWKGKLGISPAGADFQAIVSAVLALKGEPATVAWLKGIKANAKVYQDNGPVMKAVNDGEIQAGVIYHYYWYKDQAESGANSKNVKLFFFGKKDPGAFLSISGAGVIKSSKHPVEAQQLVKYLNSPAGQRILAASEALEYPIGKGAVANKALKPLSELDPPTVAVSQLDGPKVVSLMQQSGLL
ncbi:MAG: iron(III) transport system substrate-binding protein [Actinomycetota bacterium]|jgi:iron(III) transport system substrate-binding protein|nr:iron(III) transport system substrate-binding protein [Actinomycetota bacterium]